MIEVQFSAYFKKVYKRRIAANSAKKEAFHEKLKIFKIDPFTPNLRTHKLSGDLRDNYSFRIGYDLRVVFQFTNDGNVVLLDIGTHKDVY